MAGLALSILAGLLAFFGCLVQVEFGGSDEKNWLIVILSAILFVAAFVLATFRGSWPKP